MTRSGARMDSFMGDYTKIATRVARDIKVTARKAARVSQRALRNHVPVDEGDLKRSFKIKTRRGHPLKPTVEIVSFIVYAQAVDKATGYVLLAQRDSEAEVLSMFEDSIDRTLGEFI